MDKFKGEDLQELTEAKWQILTTSFNPNKSLIKVKAIAELIEKIQPDICLLTEVGGLESLSNFNLFFLQNHFEVICPKSNSDRGIDLGILLKKELKESHHIKFHKKKVFARGVLELTLKHHEKRITFLLTHLKSKISKATDFEGRSQRQIEVHELVKIFQKIDQKYKQPLFICGDLNGILCPDTTDIELLDLANKLGLKDVFEHLNRDNFERASFLYYNTSQETHLMQLDYFLLSDQWRELIDPASCVLDFDGGKRETIPATRDIKLNQPSDHYPLYIKLNLDKYWC